MRLLKNRKKLNFIDKNALPPPKALIKLQAKNICTIDVEGVVYKLNWDTFPVHGFVFIKCLNVRKVMQKVGAHGYKYRVKLMIRSGIHNGYWGVGIWRTA